MASQAGQDAKFFTRGKIQVRRYQLRVSVMGTHTPLCPAGVSCRATSSRVKGQEVCQEEDRAEEDCGKYHYGERQSVRFASLIVRVK